MFRSLGNVLQECFIIRNTQYSALKIFNLERRIQEQKDKQYAYILLTDQNGTPQFWFTAEKQDVLEEDRSSEPIYRVVVYLVIVDYYDNKGT
jgi:predicted patatin/cPLA2 family phospholipase